MTPTTLATALDYFKSAGSVLKDWRVRYIIPMAIMFAMENAFFTLIYPTCIAASTQLGNDSVHYVGLASCLVGVGELVGTGIQSIGFMQKYRGYSFWYVFVKFNIFKVFCSFTLSSSVFPDPTSTHNFSENFSRNVSR